MLYSRFTRALLMLLIVFPLAMRICFIFLRSRRVMTSRFTRTLMSLYLRFPHALLMLLLLGQKAGRQAAARLKKKIEMHLVDSRFTRTLLPLYLSFSHAVHILLLLFPIFLGQKAR